MSDQKINPKHYTLPNGMQVYDVTQHFDFTVGNCIKYLMRAGNKEGESSLDDLKKCQWYLSQLIEKEELKHEDRPENEVGNIVDRVHLCPPSVFDGSSWTD